MGKLLFESNYYNAHLHYYMLSCEIYGMDCDICPYLWITFSVYHQIFYKSSAKYVLIYRRVETIRNHSTPKY